MIVYALSDMHGRLPKVPKCDVCIIAGDVCPVENHSVAYQQKWLDTTFRTWLEQIPTASENIIGIAGNHDMIFESNPELVPDLPWRYLLDESVYIDGLQIYGTPYQKMFCDWPFMKEEYELEALWKDMPNCDIVVCHGPPYGAGDLVKFAGPQGSTTLASKLEELNIPWCITGHIHENYGIHRLGSTQVANVAVCDNNYIRRHEPMLIPL